MITEIELKYEGEDGEAEANSAKEEVENFELVVDVIKESETFMSVLGIDDKDEVNVSKVKSVAEIDGEIKVEKEGTKKAGVDAKLFGIILGGAGVALLAGSLVLMVMRRSRRNGSQINQQYYYDLDQPNNYQFQESPLGVPPSPTYASNRQVQLNPLSL